MKNLIILMVAIAFTIAACASGPTHTKNDAQGAIIAATHQNKRAAKKSYEWNNTRKWIKKAKAAMKKGDYDKAVKLANKAKREATLALIQAEDQKNAGPH